MSQGCGTEKGDLDARSSCKEPIGHWVLEGPCPPHLPSCSCVSYFVGFGGFLKKIIINKGYMKPLIFWLSFETAQKSPPPLVSHWQEQ